MVDQPSYTYGVSNTTNNLLAVVNWFLASFEIPLNEYARFTYVLAPWLIDQLQKLKLDVHF